MDNNIIIGYIKALHEMKERLYEMKEQDIILDNDYEYEINLVDMKIVQATKKLKL